MPIDYINERLVEELKILEPFGQGNEKPLFAQKQVMNQKLPCDWKELKMW